MLLTFAIYLIITMGSPMDRFTYENKHDTWIVSDRRSRLHEIEASCKYDARIICFALNEYYRQRE